MARSMRRSLKKLNVLHHEMNEYCGKKTETVVSKTETIVMYPT